MTMRDQALALARAGFKIFPITPGRKAPPLVMGWQLCATNEEVLINEWWASWPKANIGIHCDGMIVLDIDIKKGGVSSLNDLSELHPEVVDTCAVTTPSGGQHLYFKSADAVANGVNIFPGIDVRSKNGYVLGPGSVVDGQEYIIANTTPMRDAPDWVKALKPPKEPDAIREPPPAGINQDTAKQQAIAWLKMLNPVQEGERNHKGFAASAKLRDFGVTDPDARFGILREHWKCEPPLDDAELMHVSRTPDKYAQNTAGSLSAEAMFDALPPEPKAGRHTIRGKMQLSEVLRVEYLVQGVVSPASTLMIFGTFSAGKTFFTLDLAAHIAAGKAWCERRVHQGGVILFTYEGNEGLRKRLYALQAKYPDIAWDKIPLWIEPIHHRLVQHGEGREFVKAAIEDFKAEYGEYPRFICFDPLRNAIGGSDSDSDRTTDFINYMIGMRKHYNACVCVVHHTGWGNQQRSRGDSGIPAGMDTVIIVDKENREIRTDKQRDDAPFSVGYKLEVVTLGKTAEDIPVTSCVFEWLPLTGSDLPDKQQKVYQAAVNVCSSEGFVERTAVAEELDMTKGAFDAAWRHLAKRKMVFRVGQRWKVDTSAALAVFTELDAEGTSEAFD